MLINKTDTEFPHLSIKRKVLRG